jgi:GNAT superfamily N-acetyltransferase
MRLHSLTTYRRKSASSDPAPSWGVRLGFSDDAAKTVAAVARLLEELGGDVPPIADMLRAASGLLEERTAGLVLLAEADGEAIGVLAASTQTAIHAPGAYLLIQDLWVHPAWRRRSVGAGLVTSLGEHARARGLERIEVGLPRESFPRIAATEAFYRDNGFSPLGARLRMVLA